MVLLDESLRLALAIFNTQRSGVPLRTLWRDETTGALSPENADRYVAMLRRAMELGGFERCLFIAHAEQVWQQADARIFIENGAVSFDEERAAA
jgi:ABC-type lipoprotein export system ATPase subunit